MVARFAWVVLSLVAFSAGVALCQEAVTPPGVAAPAPEAGTPGAAGSPVVPAAGTPAQQANLTTPLISIARTGVAPEIDGLRTEPLWSRAMRITHFVRLDGAARPENQTEVFLTYDDAALYVAVSCDEGQLEKLSDKAKTRDSEEILRDDFIELLIAPSRTSPAYSRILINPAGTVADLGGADGSVAWTCEGLQVQAQRGSFRWLVELAIPFSALGAKPADGDVWGFNVARYRSQDGEFSCYAGAGTGVGYRSPGNFATLVFAGSTIIVDLVDIGDLFGELKGGAELKVRLRSTQPRRATPVARVIRGFDEQRSGYSGVTVDVPALNPARIVIPYEVEDSRGAVIQLGVLDDAGATVFLSPKIPLKDTWLRPRLREVQKLLEGYLGVCQEMGTGPRVSALAETIIALHGRAGAAIESLSSGYGHAARWQQVTAETEVLRGEAARAAREVAFVRGATAAQVAAGQLPDFIVWNRPWMSTMNYYTAPDPAAVKPRVYLFGVPGEYEPASFAVTASRDLTDVKVTVTDLALGGATIPKDNIDVRVVKCWLQSGRGPTKEPGRKYLVPELLVKDDRVDLVGPRPDVRVTGDPVTNIEKDASRQFWLTVRVPAGTPAGLYTGTITVAPGNAPAQTLQLQVKVLGLQLNAPTQRYCIYYRGALAGTGPETTTEDLMRLDLQNIQQHGFDQATMYEPPEGLERALALRKTLGMAGATPYSMHGVAGEDVEAFVQGITRKYAGTEAPELLYFNPYLDEPSSPGLLEQAKAFASVVKAGGGKVMLTIDREYARLCGDAVDALNYDVQGSGFRDYVVAVLKATEQPDPRPESYYWQCLAEDPTVNRFFAGFYLYKSRLDGICPNAFQYLAGNADPYDDFGGQSVLRPHMVTYPSTNGPVDTVQWEAMREGRDDLRYLVTLQALMAEARAYSTDPRVAEQLRLAEAENDLVLKTLQADHVLSLSMLAPEWYQQHRWEVAVRILRLQEALAATAARPAAPPTVTPPPDTGVAAPSVAPVGPAVTPGGAQG